MTAAQSPIRHFLRSSAKMALLYAASTGLAFAVGVALARMLGATGYGVYAVAMTIATLIGMLTEFGLPVLAMREVSFARSSGEWGPVRGLIAWADRAILALSLVLLAGTAAWLAVRPLNSANATPATLLWAAALVPFAGIARLRAFVLLALDRVFSSQFPVMVLRPLFFLTGCLLVWGSIGSLSPTQALAAQAIGAAIVMLIAVYQYHRARPAELVAARPQRYVARWLSASLPMGMTEGLRLLQGQLALLLVGFLASAGQAGIYRVADAIAQVTAIVASVAGTAATPLFSRLWGEGDHTGLERVAVLSAWAITLGAMLLGLPILLLGNWLFPAIFGAEFGSSLPVFLILWLGLVLSGGFGLTLALANMTGAHALTTRSFLLIALVNLILGLILVPQFGAIGGAISTVCGILAGTAWCAWRYHHRTGLNGTLFQRQSFSIGWAAALDTWRRFA